MKTLIAAVAVAVLGFSSAYAAEGNSEPFPNNAAPAATRMIRQAQAPDTGSAQYPNVVGRPGSNLPLLAGNVLPVNGSEGIVQTANSLPRGFEQGTVAYAQAQSVDRWMVAHNQATTIRTASR